MAIKQELLLSRMEFDEALVRLRLSISEVSKETKIPRTYLSEFRNGDRQLRPEMLSKLRDFFESKGLEFEEVPPSLNTTENTHTEPPTTAPLAAAPYRFVPVYIEADQPTVIKTQNTIQDNDARIAVLLQQLATREDSFFSDSDFSEDTKEAFHEVYSLMAANYALWRSLSGWPALGLNPDQSDPQTIRDIVFDAFAEQFEKAGLIPIKTDHSEVDEEEGV